MLEKLKKFEVKNATKITGGLMPKKHSIET